MKKPVVKRETAKKGTAARLPVVPETEAAKKSRRVRMIPQVELDGSADWTEFQKHEFLRYLEVTANVSASARLIGKKAAAAERLRKKDQRFADAWQEVFDTAIDTLEAATLHRATRGVKRGRYYEGKRVAYEKYFSDQLAMFMLRAHRADVYGKADHDDPVDPNLKLQVRELLDKRLALLDREPAEGDADKTGGAGA